MTDNSTSRTPTDDAGCCAAEPLIFEQGASGTIGVSLPVSDVPPTDRQQALPPALLGDPQQTLHLPEVGEFDVVRHFTHLAHRLFSVDHNFYPLGSCTMKYNPKINELAAALPGFAALHPYQPRE